MMASMAMVQEENQLPLITPLLAALDKSCRRSAQEQPSSLSPRSRKRRYQDTGPYGARFSSRFPLSSVLHERRARANGEELEKYQSWYWAASGMAHEKADFQKTVKRWRANQPLCQHQGDPNVRGKSGSRLPSSRSQQIRALSRGPDPSLLQREWDISQRKPGGFSGPLLGLQHNVFQGFQWARRAFVRSTVQAASGRVLRHSPGLSTRWLGCSRLCYRC
jgi:hypothetical protein